MLVELAVTDLGVIAELQLVLGSGMTAVTGETGAGKTLVVEALSLLVGGRADGTVVRAGADEAVVEGRFDHEGTEVVVRRVVPSHGRSRAYVDGRLATVAELAEWGRRLVDLHGQHAHQSLLSTAVQRSALDRFGEVDLAPLSAARAELRAVEDELAELGGDDRSRARQLDLLRFQLDELDGAAIDGPDEDERLEAEEDALADALAHREAGGVAAESLTGDGGAVDALATALAAVEGRTPFAAEEARLRSTLAELTDVAATVRQGGEAIEEDPERLAAIGARRKLLHDLRRKYGETLAEVLTYRDEVAAELAALESRDAVAAELDARRVRARQAVAAAEEAVGAARRAAAPRLATAVEANLADLALAKARLEVDVGPGAGDEVTFRLAANPGSPPLPLAKVASGGELARTMLALRLVLSQAPDTLVFDEVDAGIGGSAALAVGAALAELGRGHQVLVVTHLPQVAAAADHQVVVAKSVRRGATYTSVAPVADDDRVVELARMLSGTPDSDAARRHAQELLDAPGARG
jgi:DNA repair protein RecN (Recombination protein N)